MIQCTFNTHIEVHANHLLWSEHFCACMWTWLHSKQIWQSGACGYIQACIQTKPQLQLSPYGVLITDAHLPAVSGKLTRGGGEQTWDLGHARLPGSKTVHQVSMDGFEWHCKQRNVFCFLFLSNLGWQLWLSALHSSMEIFSLSVHVCGFKLIPPSPFFLKK